MYKRHEMVGLCPTLNDKYAASGGPDEAFPVVVVVFCRLASISLSASLSFLFRSSLLSTITWVCVADSRVYSHKAPPLSVNTCCRRSSSSHLHLLPRGIAAQLHRPIIFRVLPISGVQGVAPAVRSSIIKSKVTSSLHPSRF